jgi:hypothetical protein
MEQRSPRHDALRAQGWERKFAASEPRLSEAREEYEALGFEVLLEPPESPAEGDECAACLQDDLNPVWVIYTRRRQTG